jgi:heat shock protein HslJ
MRTLMQNPAVILIFITMTFTACLTGCTGTPPPEELTENTWVLISYNDGENGLVSAPPAVTATLVFHKNGQLSGNAGCNDYFGPYRIEGGLLYVGQVGSTEKYCLSSAGIMEFEQSYLSLLKETTRYNIDGEQLILSYYDERKLLVFMKG